MLRVLGVCGIGGSREGLQRLALQQLGQVGGFEGLALEQRLGDPVQRLVAVVDEQLLRLVVEPGSAARRPPRRCLLLAVVLALDHVAAEEDVAAALAVGDGADDLSLMPYWQIMRCAQPVACSRSFEAPVER